MQNNIGEKTKKIIDEYLNFSFNKSPAVALPYSNNKVGKRLAGLRAFIGKGTPEDIRAELKILSLSKKINPSQMGAEDFKKFLVDNALGIDCSGLVYHILDTYMKEMGSGLAKKIIFPFRENFLRKIIRRLRPAQNAEVAVFDAKENSKNINAKDARFGDIITIISAEKERNHIVLVLDKEERENIYTISYIHSIKWDMDGKYDHGVRLGKIEFKKGQKITEGLWSEKGEIGENNKTYKRALSAETNIKRLLCLSN